jgi:hypothetical protein
MATAVQPAIFEEVWIPILVHLIIEGIGAQSQVRCQAAPAGAKDIEPNH